jgi:arylformamidase
MDVIDISRSVSETTAVWPGDRSVEQGWSAQIEEGDSVNVGYLSLSLHTATHVDAPYHVAEEGARTDALPLSAFLGPARVVEVPDDDAIRPRHLPESTQAPRLLFKTAGSRVPDDDWPNEICPVAPKTVEALSARGTVCIGTDAPSVDPLDSTSLTAHHALQRAGIVHLEGLRLQGVAPGPYRLVALPLKVPDVDAAPVRAVLLPPS